MAQTRPSTTAPRLPQQANREAQAVADAVELLQRQVKSAVEQALSPPFVFPCAPDVAALDTREVAVVYAPKRATVSKLGIVSFADIAANATDYKTFDVWKFNVNGSITTGIAPQQTTATVGLTHYVPRWFQMNRVSMAAGDVLAVIVGVAGAGVQLLSFAVIGE